MPPNIVKILFIIMISELNLSCNTVDKNLIEEKNDSTNNVTLPELASENPGEVVFKLKIITIYDAEYHICESAKKNVVLVEVLQLLKRGRNIVNIPHVNDEILISFLLSPKNIQTNTVIEATAKEMLCTDVSKTYFSINSFRVLE